MNFLLQRIGSAMAMRTLRELTAVKNRNNYGLNFCLDFELFFGVTLPLWGFCIDVAHCTHYATVCVVKGLRAF